MLAVALISGCAGTSAAPVSRHSESQLPGTLTTQVADSQCPHGLGIGVDTAEWISRAASQGKDFPTLAVAMLANGDTLAVASGAPTPRTAIVAEFRTPCELNPDFGRGGATQLAFGRQGVSISAVLPMADGGALIAGSTSESNAHWLVGRLTADGQPDAAFGHDGWASLPWGYTATALAQMPNGDIVVGGDGNENGSSYTSELTSDGGLVRSFGVAGRTRMPPWHDGGVQGVWVEPSGNILAIVGGGNSGCWGVIAVELTPTGERVSGFARRFQRGLHQAVPTAGARFPFIVFVGDIAVEPDGFHLIGTAQNTCVDNGLPRPNPTQRIRDVAFGYDGSLDTSFGENGVTSFPAPIADAAWAFPQADGDTLLVTSPDASDRNHVGRKGYADLLVYRLTHSGALDTTYAHDGVADLSFPDNADNCASDEVGAQPVSNGRQVEIATTTASGNAIVLSPVPSSTG